MGKQKATAAELMAMLDKEIAAQPECEGIKAVDIFACEGEGSWTPALKGLDPETGAPRALSEIVNRLFDAYELAPVRH